MKSLIALSLVLLAPFAALAEPVAYRFEASATPFGVMDPSGLFPANGGNVPKLTGEIVFDSDPAAYAGAAGSTLLLAGLKSLRGDDQGRPLEFSLNIGEAVFGTAALESPLPLGSTGATISVGDKGGLSRESFRFTRSALSRAQPGLDEVKMTLTVVLADAPKPVTVVGAKIADLRLADFARAEVTFYYSQIKDGVFQQAYVEAQMNVLEKVK